MPGQHINFGNPVADHPLNRGLVSWWLPLPNNSGGSKLFDLCGRNHGTLTNGPTWRAGRNGFAALSFDGTDDHVNPGDIYGSITSEFTVAVHCRTGVLGALRNVVFRGDVGAGQFGIYVGFPASGTWAVQPGNIAGATSVVADTDYHFAYTVGAAAGTVTYLNGKQDASNSGQTSVTAKASTSLYLGADVVNARYWNGRIYSVSFHTRALSSSEVFALYEESMRGYPTLLRRWSPHPTYFLGPPPLSIGGYFPGQHVDLGNPVADHPLTRGLVNWWLPLPNNYGGSKLFDIKGGSHGTLTSGPTWSSGQGSERSVAFDGSDDYVNCGDLATFEGVSALTVIARVYFTNNGVQFAAIVSKVSSGHVGMFMCTGGAGAGDSTKLFLGARIGNNSEDGFTGTSLFATGKWYDVVYRFDGSGAANSDRLRAFVDGQEYALSYRGTIPASLPTNSQPVTFGGPSPNNCMAGRISSVAVWNRALSPSEIYAWYAQSSQSYPDVLRRWSRPITYIHDPVDNGGYFPGQHVDLGNPVADHPLNRGLVNWWLPLPNNSGGSRWFDLCGRNHGTLSSGVTWSTVPLHTAPALAFNGSSSVAFSPSFTGAPCTFAVWCRPESLSGNDNLLVANNSGNGNHSFGIAFSNGSIQVYAGDGSYTITSATISATAGQWYLVVGVFAAANSRTIYANGGNAATSSVSRNPSGINRLSFGVFNNQSPSDYFHGVAGAAWTWDRELSATEVACLYDQCLRGFPDLLRRWSLPRWASGAFTSNSYAATAALSVGVATASASATHTAPAYTATSDLTINGPDLAASATFTAPTYTATAAVSTGVATSATTASFSPGTKTATSDLTINGPDLAASATRTAPTYAATSDLTINGPDLTASTTFTAPTYTATAALTINGPDLSASATHVTPTYAATAAVSTGVATLQASAAFSPGTKTATATLTINGPDLSASATHVTPTYTGTATITAGAASADATAAFSPGTKTATATLSINGPDLSASATHTTPTYAATAAAIVGEAILASSATFSPGTKTATATLAINGPDLSASATHTTPTYTATADLIISSPDLLSSATFAAGTKTATASLAAGASTASASATHTVPTYAATMAVTAAGSTMASSATFSPGTKTGSSTVTAGAATMLAFNSPAFIATAALAAGATVVATTATFSPGTKTATASLSTPEATASASSTFSPGTKTATATLSAPEATASASSTFSPGTKTATASLSASPATADASTSFLPGTKTSTAFLIVGDAALSASSAFSPGTKTASVTLSVPRPSIDTITAFSPGTKTATAAVVVGGIIIAADGIVDDGAVEATSSLIVGAIIMATTGTYSMPTSGSAGVFQPIFVGVFSEDIW